MARFIIVNSKKEAEQEAATKEVHRKLSLLSRKGKIKIKREPKQRHWSHYDIRTNHKSDRSIHNHEKRWVI